MRCAHQKVQMTTPLARQNKHDQRLVLFYKDSLTFGFLRHGFSWPSRGPPTTGFFLCLDKGFWVIIFPRFKFVPRFGFFNLRIRRDVSVELFHAVLEIFHLNLHPGSIAVTHTIPCPVTQSTPYFGRAIEPPS